MAAEKSQTGTATTTVESSAPRAIAASCAWMKPGAKDCSFVAKFKHQFSGFIHAPMDDHKACFKTTIQKMVGRFSLPKGGENKWVAEAQAAPEK